MRDDVIVAVTTTDSPIAESGVPERTSHINPLDSRMGAPAVAHAREHVEAGSNVGEKDVGMDDNTQDVDMLTAAGSARNGPYCLGALHR